MITNRDILGALTAYLERYPEEAAGLSEPSRLLSEEADCASRRTFPVHATAGALLTRGDTIMLVDHRAYGIVLQPGGHLEPADVTLSGAAERELAEETGIDPGAVFCVSQVPAYVEFGRVPARPSKCEPAHFHLDFGYAFATADGDVGRIQESEVTGARWYPLAEAERLVGHRIGRAVSVPPDWPTGPRWTLPPFAGLPAPARELCTLAESVGGRWFRGSGVLLQTAAPGRPRVTRPADCHQVAQAGTAELAARIRDLTARIESQDAELAQARDEVTGLTTERDVALDEVAGLRAALRQMTRQQNTAR